MSGMKSVAIAPGASFRFLIQIFAPIASAALLAKKSPKPTPLFSPARLKGAKRSIVSSIPGPSSITSILIPPSTGMVRNMIVPLGLVNLMAFWTKF